MVILAKFRSSTNEFEFSNMRGHQSNRGGFIYTYMFFVLRRGKYDLHDFHRRVETGTVVYILST